MQTEGTLIVKQILVVYNTAEGQTEKIAKYVAAELAKNDRRTDIADIIGFPKDFDWSAFDGAIICASIHLGKHSGRFVKFIQRHLDRLDTLPSLFLSVSLSAKDGHGEEYEKAVQYINELSNKTGWTPTLGAPVAGALAYQQYGFFKRVLMKSIARSSNLSTDITHDHEFTDWTALEKLVDDFVDTNIAPG